MDRRALHYGMWNWGSNVMNSSTFRSCNFILYLHAGATFASPLLCHSLVSVRVRALHTYSQLPDWRCQLPYPLYSLKIRPLCLLSRSVTRATLLLNELYGTRSDFAHLSLSSDIQNRASLLQFSSWPVLSNLKIWLNLVSRSVLDYPKF